MFDYKSVYSNYVPIIFQLYPYKSLLYPHKIPMNPYKIPLFIPIIPYKSYKFL